MIKQDKTIKKQNLKNNQRKKKTQQKKQNKTMTKQCKAN